MKTHRVQREGEGGKTTLVTVASMCAVHNGQNACASVCSTCVCTAVAAFSLRHLRPYAVTASSSSLTHVTAHKKVLAVATAARRRRRRRSWRVQSLQSTQFADINISCSFSLFFSVLLLLSRTLIPVCACVCAHARVCALPNEARFYARAPPGN